ncbi:MAG: S26 family signal peptidase [Novosphingobium sp.]
MTVERAGSRLWPTIWPRIWPQFSPQVSPRLWPRLALLGGLGAAALVLGAVSSFAASHAFMLNVSPSLPYWAIWLEPGRPAKRGDILVFLPPRSALLTAHFGVRERPFAKYAVGLPGDEVTRQGRRFFVNGHEVALAKPATKRGEALALGPTGTLPAGCYFAATPHPDGFDSRYGEIGWICAPRILGSGRPIL